MVHLGEVVIFVCLALMSFLNELTASRSVKLTTLASDLDNRDFNNETERSDVASAKRL